MIPLHIASIKVTDNRIRRQFDERYIAELATSIDLIGLIHLVTVRPNGDGFELVAGEQRLRAMKKLIDAGKTIRPTGGDVAPQALLPGYVPCQRTDELTEAELLQVELEENIIRRDISWQERSSAVAKLHSLRGTQRAQEGLAPQTIKATATEVLGHSPSGTEAKTVSTQILLARHLDDPDVQKAKSEQEAVNILRKKLTNDFVGELAAINPATSVSSKHTCILGDSRIVLATTPAAKYDCIIADPPYGIGADKMVAQGGSEAGTKHEYEDSIEYATEFLEQSLPIWSRVCRPEAHIYMFCHITLYNQWATMFDLNGWDVWPVPLIWSKNGQGNIIGNVDGPRRTYEAILYARRGGRKVQRVGSDVLSHAPARNRRHAAEKPVSLYIELLSCSVLPGQEVLDPCCGSGPIFVAANTIGLVATGIERVETHYNIARTRMDSKSDELADVFDDDVPF